MVDTIQLTGIPEDAEPSYIRNRLRIMFDNGDKPFRQHHSTDFLFPLDSGIFNKEKEDIEYSENTAASTVLIITHARVYFRRVQILIDLV